MVMIFDPKERYDGKGSQEEEDGQSDDNGDNSDEYDFGDDLYKNEDDRRKLSEMTELQREMILSDRATKKYDKDLLGEDIIKVGEGKDNCTWDTYFTSSIISCAVISRAIWEILGSVSDHYAKDAECPVVFVKHP
ncbi:uncharacterized protein HKW66_Vig0178630 [Vigna angularis]|uniref:Uncharacterized protein n=1 Tax=Phaseolus angularis TaxID=3914 RepID=A0A8T0JYB5_PHAAN|nr:uncharacterized protein HKW66_Vig0178630 [Vigna angularis]